MIIGNTILDIMIKLFWLKMYYNDFDLKRAYKDLNMQCQHFSLEEGQVPLVDQSGLIELAQ